MTPDATMYTPDMGIYYTVRILIIVVGTRDLIRKGIALRKAGNRKQIARFICLFIFNTAGILPIIYIFLFSDKNKQETKQLIEKIEKKGGASVKYAEGSIEHTIAKVEKLIKKGSIIKKKPVVKKTSNKKPVVKKNK